MTKKNESIICVSVGMKILSLCIAVCNHWTSCDKIRARLVPSYMASASWSLVKHSATEPLRSQVFPDHTRLLFLELGICSTSAILELYLFSKFLHFEEIVRVKMAVCFEMIVSET